VLGVPSTATAEEIRLAFRARAMESHPDQGAGGGNGETFRLIREAYEVLRDPRRRMAYDATRHAAGEHASANGSSGADGFVERRAAGGVESGPAPASDSRFEGAPGAGPRPDDGARAAPRSSPRPTNGTRMHWDRSAWRTAAWSQARRAFHGGSSRLWPLVAAGLALLLIVAIGSLWSAHRQLDDRQGIVADLYHRLSRLADEHAELRSRYRSLAFLDLERAQRRGSAGWGGPITADIARAIFRFDIGFAGGAIDLGPATTQELTRAMVEIAAQIDRLPPESEWMIVLEAQAARAAIADQVAVESWEAGLLRLATVLDHLLAQGLPGERVAIRFNAGFAADPSPGDATTSTDSPAEGAFDRVTIQLLCCVD
jgi:hypothetical protein